MLPNTELSLLVVAGAEAPLRIPRPARLQRERRIHSFQHSRPAGLSSPLSEPHLLFPYPKFGLVAEHHTPGCKRDPPAAAGFAVLKF